MITSFESVVQSYKDIIVNTNNDFSANVQIQRMPSGTGRHLKADKKGYIKKTKIDNKIIGQLTTVSIQEYCKSKNSIINVVNSDNMCLLRAILIAIKYADDHIDKKEYAKQNNKEIIGDINYIRKLINIPDTGCGLEEIQQIESLFRDYCITVIDGNTNKDGKYLYRGLKNKKYLYLCYTGSHYNVINSMPAFLNVSYYCNICRIGYSNAYVHNCPESCKSCKQIYCNKFSNVVLKCRNCNITANSEQCLQRHYDIICNKREICKICKSYKSKKHVCFDQKYCIKCKTVVDLNHKCFIPNNTTADEEFEGYIFFDYEARVENGIHVPNLVIAHKVCKNCIDTDKRCSENCQKICVDNNDIFCTWLFNQKNCIAIAHNAKGYDSIFINEWINNSINIFDKTPDFIRVGSKILSIKFRSVKIICSLSFLPMGLDKFAKTFNLHENKKGFFPHLFNTKENANYIGEYPSADFYQVKFMSQSKKEEFENWYNKAIYNKDGSKSEFNFKKELIAYCASDVDILEKGCFAFRKIIMDQTQSNENPGIDPFRKSITIASLCHYIYRTILMEPESIAIIPENGYHCNEKTSRKAFQWLKFMSESLKINIQHAKNKGELKLGNYRIDGYHEESNTIYEFHGCLWHGCLKCYKADTFNNFLQSTIAGINGRHQTRINAIKNIVINDKKINLVEIWECEWDKKCQDDEFIQNFLSTSDIKSPLSPRDAFFGGRTEAIKLYHEVSGDEKIKYYDYTSLYPDVQKYCEYPIGHPVIITENFKDLSCYFGFMKCKVLPPKKLYFPVLPARINGKLLFALCKTCAFNRLDECNHSDEDKALEGTWCTLELNEAVNQGYKITKIYEVWHFESTSKYNKNTKSGGIFTSYINMFLKGKQEASGYPKDVVTDQDKQRYIDDYFENEGVKLDKSKIKLNEGMRTICKLLLNSFWGRFGMNSNKQQYKLIRDPCEWLALIADDQYKVQSADFTNKKFLQVYYTHTKDLYESISNVNVAVAAFVTCHARLKLYGELKKLKEKILYMDTDSMIFISRPNEYEPKTGKYLGQLTNEIDSKKGNFISKFVSAGPKNYSYTLDSGKSCALVKGFALNNTSVEKINFDSISRIVTSNQNEKILIEQLQFKRKKNYWTNSTSIISKSYGFVYDKRILLDSFGTLPYGY